MTIGLDAGSLDRRITIQQPAAAVDDGYTRRAGGFADVATVWASVRRAPGNERFASGENAATATTIFRARWRPGFEDVDPTYRVRFEGRLYDLKSVDEIGRRDGLEMVGVVRTDQEAEA